MGPKKIPRLEKGQMALFNVLGKNDDREKQDEDSADPDHCSQTDIKSNKLSFYEGWLKKP